MASVDLQLNGIDEARARLSNLAVTAKGFGREVSVGSKLPYAYGQETGRHRVSGKLARRSGPTYYLTFAAQEVLDQATPDLLAGWQKVADGKRPITGLGMVRRIGRWIARLARRGAPKQSGALRRSIKTTVGNRG